MWEGLRCRAAAPLFAVSASAQWLLAASSPLDRQRLAAELHDMTPKRQLQILPRVQRG
jgi:hypothetical protein